MGGCIKVRFVRFEELKEEMDVLKKYLTVSKKVCFMWLHSQLSHGPEKSYQQKAERCQHKYTRENEGSRV